MMGKTTQTQVRSNSAVSMTRGSARILQRKCACGIHTIGGGQCGHCKDTEGTLQRAASWFAGVSEAPPIVYEVLRSPGQPLDVATRAYFEPRFGHDFSKVRLHSDDKAKESARAVNAIAYTVGRHIVLGDGRSVSISKESRRTMAHELAHTIQQESSVEGVPEGVKVTSPNDGSERGADATAHAVLGDNTGDGSFGLTRNTDTAAVTGRPQSGRSERPHMLQRELAPTLSSDVRKVVFFFPEEGFSDANQAVLTGRPNHEAKVRDACKAVWELVEKGDVEIKMKGGCANANDDSSDQAKRQAVWIANAQVKWIRDQMDRTCGPFAKNKKIKIYSAPPGLSVGVLTPEVALSIFPKLYRQNRVEVEIGSL